MTATEYVSSVDYVFDSHGYPFMQWYGVGVTRFTHSLVVRCVAVNEKHMYSIQLIVVPTPGGGGRPVLYLCIVYLILCSPWLARQTINTRIVPLGYVLNDP